MRKVFIDGGAHEGESVDLFHRLYSDALEYDIYSFEPNPNVWPKFDDKRTILCKEALWIEDGEKDFYIGGYSEGSTLFTDKASGRVDYDHPIKVKTIRLSKWITDNFKKEDYIFLKLDVEGAEYAILDDLIDTGTIEYVDYLCGELHTTGGINKIRSLPAGEDVRILNRLKAIGVEFHDWNNNHL